MAQNFLQYWVIRLPNFIKLDSKPFHPDMYVGPEQDDDATGDADAALKERSMSIKMEVENTVRWRWNKDEDGIDVSGSFFVFCPVILI